MKNNTCKESCFRSSNFDLYSQIQLVDTLAKWLKEPKKNRKQLTWNSLIYTLATMVMPEVDMNQLLISHEFFIDKMVYLLGLSSFKTQTLFNGVQIKISQTFIAFDTECKLQKVIVQGTQIKQVTPIEAFKMIKRQDVICEDRKKRLYIYNRQKSKNSTYLSVELKVLEKTKNQLFREDYLNKMKFFTNYVFGEHCPSFCVSGINVIEIKENQWLDERAHLHSANIYLIYSGRFVCFLQTTNQLKSQKGSGKSEVNNDTKKSGKSEVNNDTKRSTRAQSAKKSKRGLSASHNHSHSQGFKSKIQLNKGSIIQSSSFQQILTITNQLSTHKFQSCKAVSHSLLFQIKSSQFHRTLSADKKCMQYFISQYQKVLLSRKLLLSQSLETLNKFFMLNQQSENKTQIAFSISRRKNYSGFRSSRTQKSPCQEVQNLSTVQIYNTMIRNKEKVLSLQKQYKQKNKSLTQKTNFRYEDSKKIKENYKRMKIKDYQIQKLVFRNSVSNIKDLEGFKNAKSRFGQVKGMFEDEIEQVQKVIMQQRKAVMEEEMNKQNKVFKRKITRLNSYSPQTTKHSYFKQSLTDNNTFQNIKRASLNQNPYDNIFKGIQQEYKFRYQGNTQPMRNSNSTAMIDLRMTVNNLRPSIFQFVVDGIANANGNGNTNREQRNVIVNQGKNEDGKEKEVRRLGKKMKTFVKHSRNVSNFKACFSRTLSSLAI